MIRLGLCCIFRDEPIKFRTTTAAAVKKLRPHERLAKLSDNRSSTSPVRSKVGRDRSHIAITTSSTSETFHSVGTT